MARWALVDPQSHRILQIAAQQFAVAPPWLWVDVSSRSEPDWILTQSSYDDGVFDIFEPAPEPAHPPLPLDQVSLLAQQANDRLNRGVEAGKEALDRVADDISARQRQRRQLTVEDLEQQISNLVDAVRAQLTAQQAHAPPEPVPMEPTEPAPQAAPATRRPTPKPTPTPPKRGGRK